MSAFKKGKIQKPKQDSTISINPALFKEVESLIQALKNNQRCYAEAASLVNSSELRNFFEKIELERTIFMEKVGRFIERLDLVSGKSGHDTDVIWFSSIEVHNVSKSEFDSGILVRCLQCEEVLHQAYDGVIDLRGDEKIFRFLDEQKVSLENTKKRLQALEIKLLI